MLGPPMDITNKTRKPLSVPLPGGKKLFLGPGKSGQIAPKAAEHPAVKALIEAGELEVAIGGRKAQRDAGSVGVNPGGGRSGSGSGGGGVRHTGDR